jgi:hypothetical protein
LPSFLLLHVFLLLCPFFAGLVHFLYRKEKKGRFFSDTTAGCITYGKDSSKEFFLKASFPLVV